MPLGSLDLARERIDEVVALVRARLEPPHRDRAERFVRLFYESVPLPDMQDVEVEDLYGAAMFAWNRSQRREPGTPKITVYTPELEQHGWQSTHTVVEILTDDMPFLVDSVTMELSRQDLAIHLVISPMIDVCRDDAGQLTELHPRGEGPSEAVTEALLHFQIDHQSEAASLAGLEESLRRVLADVRAAVDDWPAMRTELQRVVEHLTEQPPPVDPDELAEAKAFLAWLDDDHFTFLGYRSYDLERREGGDVIVAQPDTGLGILCDAPHSEKLLADQPAEVGELARSRTLLTLTKANSPATVHRPSNLDYVGVKRFGPDGEVAGEWRFLGLYTSRVYTARPQEIPVVRKKVQAVLERAALPSGTHDAKDLLATLETYPRDELFEIGVDELFELSMGVVGLQERRRVRLFLRRDRFGRYFTGLVYVPRDRYNTESRLKMQDVLIEAFDATGLEHRVSLSTSVLARLHFTVYTVPGRVDPPDVEELEARLAAATRTWSDDLQVALIEEFGEERGTRLGRDYEHAFPAAYREDHAPRIAVADLEHLQRLGPAGDLELSLARPVEAPQNAIRLKLFRSGAPNTLSQVLPLLENLGFVVVDQRPYAVRPTGSATVWIHDFGLRVEPADALDTAEARQRFQEAFRRVWDGDSENDGFNGLVLCAGLDWRDVTLLRAYSRYLRQTETRFSVEYMRDALVENGGVSRLLCALFHARFDPGSSDRAGVEEIVEEIEEGLDEVVSLDQDRILRSFLALVLATLRTNFFLRDERGEPRGHLTLKLDSSAVPDLPAPRPAYEIFVYSPRTEGVHLRGGKVARGGLRWSDRREDFRTEVLGLAKAQSVKNAVIVPVGAKGGFVVKRTVEPGADPQEYRDEVQECYRIFIRGLLDVTDNIVAGSVVPPEGVVRYDDDDPYLVVAADKGTASFSDTANAIAQERGFWLGDAFASGGSAGYDHKEMGITARGAWEAVKRHFRELGIDTQSQEFSVAGIGDMSGDVFGNGMLLSRHIRLVAAFDHRHVFLDPDPDVATSYEERRRLFELPRSTWESYDRARMSEGGGVWPRSAKSIPLSPQARAALDVDDEVLTPDALVRAILRAPVDLLYNGGIGTFVKSSDETHAEVGDKATDRLRIDGRELRCRVVGEGGNLGLTQRARIEYALAGGHINTDAIDNSAGVDCSDHEVNIKILLDVLVADEDLTTKQRNALLAAMTEEVAELVLRNNVAQVHALSNADANALPMADVARRYIDHLEGLGRLQRDLEFLPADEELVERRIAGGGLTRPEYAVLLAYTKTRVYDELLDSQLPEDPALAGVLDRYFPSKLRERYGDRFVDHRLRREIIATEVANSLVNDGGTTFVFRLGEETGATVSDITRAHLVAREVFELHAVERAITALDHVVPAEIQTRMSLEARRLVERGTRWLLRHRRRPLEIEETVATFLAGTTTVRDILPELLRGDDRLAAQETSRECIEHGVPKALADRIATMPWLIAALDLVAVAADTDVGEPVGTVTEIYLALSERLHLDWLRDQIGALPRDARWETLARDALREDYFAQHSALTTDVLRTTSPDATADARVERWTEQNAAQVQRSELVLAEVESADAPDLAVLSVALREIRNLATATT